MNKIKVAISGYGNIGRYAVEALLEASDMELVGIIRRKKSDAELPSELKGVPIVTDISELGKIDIVLLCNPTRTVPELAEKLAKKGINTVDSFDIHGDALWNYRKQMDDLCKAHNTVSIISAGWDPGSNSIIRTLLLAMAPKGITHTNFGPGMSMGHSVAAKGIDGVKKALSVTIPTGTGIHRRMVYVELEEGCDATEVEKAIKTDDYFIKDQTVISPVESVDNLLDMGHATHIQRKGVSGKTQNQRFDFQMSINNPALTSQIMVSCARAITKQKPGCYTMPEIAPINFLPGLTEDLIKTLV